MVAYVRYRFTVHGTGSPSRFPINPISIQSRATSIFTTNPLFKVYFDCLYTHTHRFETAVEPYSVQGLRIAWWIPNTQSK